MKYLTTVLLGIVLHMLYLDLLVINQHILLEKCPVELECAENAQNSYDNFYGKYFGIYRLIKWDNVSTGKWRME